MQAKPKDKVKDALKLYLEEITFVPLLDSNEEKALAVQIVNNRRSVRSLVLTNDYVIRQIVKLLTRVSDGELKAIKVFDIRKKDSGAQGEGTNGIKLAISKLSELLAENRSDFRIVTSRANADDKRAARSRIKTRRAEMVRDIEPFKIRFPYLLSPFRRLEVRHERMQQLELQVSQKPTTTTRAELRRLSRYVGESEQTLSRLIARFKTAFGEWNQSKNAMIQANLRLVVRITQQYRDCGIARLDLIQAGNSGLMKAVDKFDPDRNRKFSTYAKWWIRKCIFHAIDSQGGAISLTSYAGDESRQVERVRAELRQLFGREPSTEEMAESMARNTLAESIGYEPSKNEFHEWLYGPKSDGYKVLKKFEKAVNDIDHVTSPALSTDEPGGGDKGGTIGDLISQPVCDELDAPERLLLLQGIKSQLWCLTDEEKQIISLRYGLDDIARSRKQVARMLGIKADGVIQVKKNAIAKLRKAARAKPKANSRNRRRDEPHDVKAQCTGPKQLTDDQKTLIGKETKRRVDRGATKGRASHEVRHLLLAGELSTLNNEDEKVVVDLAADTVARYIDHYE